ncbi:hypothetical protein NIES4075_66180 [Tolypothrix sp. NIES-4075]|nr:hypothetical protein NIES4075_66180 [Tolypothrix sp. NIES-4075]
MLLTFSIKLVPQTTSKATIVSIVNSYSPTSPHLKSFPMKKKGGTQSMLGLGYWLGGEGDRMMPLLLLIPKLGKVVKILQQRKSVL